MLLGEQANWRVVREGRLRIPFWGRESSRLHLRIDSDGMTGREEWQYVKICSCLYEMVGRLTCDVKIGYGVDGRWGASMCRGAT